jgi:hypothetical protein
MDSKLPTGFKSREQYNEYMKTYNRNFRKRKREEEKRKVADQAAKIGQFMNESALRRRQWLEMLTVIRVIAFTVNRTDLTDGEKVKAISKIPISDELVPYLKSKEVTA